MPSQLARSANARPAGSYLSSAPQCGQAGSDHICPTARPQAGQRGLTKPFTSAAMLSPNMDTIPTAIGHRTF
ncbi:MAG: hypothetical protein KKI08_19795, partial [Armatimonadetes bacterium]|nr:hypothetical protein [Armatimonadota bacterium]